MEFEGNFHHVNGKVAIIASKFNETVTRQLVAGAQHTLKQFGIAPEHIDVYWVPGAFELAFTSHRVLAQKKYDGIMTLGAVIKGETDHYQMIIQNITSAIAQLNLQADIPITFGMLTTSNIEQALQRAGLKVGNEGSSTAQSLLEMISLNQQMA
jgi:6,7-dimethyl-8-ribityllumazine synthase